MSDEKSLKCPPGIMIYISEYSSFRPVLSLEQKGLLLDALIDSQSGEIQNFDGDAVLQAALNILLSKIKRDAEKYSAMCERNGYIARNRRKPTIDPGITTRDHSSPNVTNSNCNSNSNSNSKIISASDGGNTQSKPQPGEAKKKAKSIPPTVEEVRQYCQERNNAIDPEQFIDYYQRSGWIMSNGQKVKDWKACIRTWERNNQKGVGNGNSRNNPADRVPGQRDLYEF